MSRKTTALITGSNRGLGKEVAKQLILRGYNVYLASRSLKNAEDVREQLQPFFKREDQWVRPLKLDLSLDSDIDRLHSLEKVEVVVNNAGVYFDSVDYGPMALLTRPFNELEDTMRVNFYGPLKLMRIFLPAMISEGYGRIVNVASGMGRERELDAFAPFYRLSKSSLIALTRIASAIVKDRENILVNAVCPGWVRTRMGGERAIRSLEEGAEGIVFAATLPKGGPNGALLRDGKIFDWDEPTVGAKPK